MFVLSSEVSSWVSDYSVLNMRDWGQCGFCCCQVVTQLTFWREEGGEEGRREGRREGRSPCFRALSDRQSDRMGGARAEGATPVLCFCSFSFFSSFYSFSSTSFLSCFYFCQQDWPPVSLVQLLTRNEKYQKIIYIYKNFLIWKQLRWT